MKEYKIRTVDNSTDLSLLSPAWNSAEVGRIDTHLWAEEYPAFFSSEFRLLKTEDALHVKMTTGEFPVRTTVEEDGGPVHLDSCLEFFWSPNIDDPGYFNFEFNAAGYLMVKYGAVRKDRKLFDYNKEEMAVESNIDENGAGWAIRFTIPFALLEKQGVELTSVSRGNFYKCGDETPTPHFASWNPVTSENPDYHRTQDFGTLVMEQ